ncbi:hypothetical protein TREES_T100015902 [Tupaia chinensis]|uniref:Uncharacterized protein n=1 Tax=Tupaia chinensis TaxID=246437 RepID=L9KXL1_TUPCH|nr:hypothetical protein TREES_T100015902 [Tupaia chinensis]
MATAVVGRDEKSWRCRKLPLHSEQQNLLQVSRAEKVALCLGSGAHEGAANPLATWMSALQVMQATMHRPTRCHQHGAASRACGREVTPQWSARGSQGRLAVIAMMWKEKTAFSTSKDGFE